MSKPKQTREMKNKIDRVRRKLVRGIETAKKNGWEIRSGMWAEAGEACAIGAALVQDIKVKNTDLDSYELNELIRDRLKYNEEATAAKFLGITAWQVGEFISGFDSAEEPVEFDEFDNSETEYHLGSPFYRLGCRLAHKYT